MARTITFDPDAIEEIDALYIIHMANKALQSDAVTNALADAAYEIANATVSHREDVYAITNRADEIYPQVLDMWSATDVHEAETAACEHLRRFGFLTGE